MCKLFGSIFLFVLPPLERPLRVDYIRYVCASLLIIFGGEGKALSRHRTNRKTDKQVRLGETVAFEDMFLHAYLQTPSHMELWAVFWTDQGAQATVGICSQTQSGAVTSRSVC